MIGHKNNKTKGTNNAPIPEDNEQYCFRMPLKLEVYKRYWTPQLFRPQSCNAVITFLNKMFQSCLHLIMVCKVARTFESVAEILKCDHSNESYY